MTIRYLSVICNTNNNRVVDAIATIIYDGTTISFDVITQVPTSAQLVNRSMLFESDSCNKMRVHLCGNTLEIEMLVITEATSLDMRHVIYLDDAINLQYLEQMARFRDFIDAYQPGDIFSYDGDLNIDIYHR